MLAYIENFSGAPILTNRKTTWKRGFQVNNMEPKKKILYIITKSNWGGAQHYVFDLAVNLPRDEFEAIVACGGSGSLFQKLSENGIRTISIPHLERNINIMKEVLSLFSLWQIFKKEKPDIIHLNSSKVGGLGALAARIYNLPFGSAQGEQPKGYKLKAKIIFTAHGWPFNENRFFLSRFIIWVLSWLTVIFSHRVIVLTQRDLDSTMNFILTALDKFHLIPNGINPVRSRTESDFSRKSKDETNIRIFSSLNKDVISTSNGVNEKTAALLERETAKKELGLNLKPTITLLGCITEFTKNKGIRYLIESVKELPNTVHLTLIGGGEERGQMEKFAKDLEVSKRIHFLGFKDGAAKYLKAFDIFVFPSIKEGLPYALLEAGIAELPIIATNVGGIPDIIDDGENGLLVEPKNPAALAEAIKKLLENKETREQFGQKISQKIKTEFSFEKMLEKTKNLYG
ncbi:MAG: hypothetical protein A3G49_05910 [Candidatus Sungbacteria bacterium RIFCSPLOWO2_12_FULL_41_11]|uniref:Glycosyl transferase family 1 domain-containing protein n=1 Tax=Candidatus Sungbacteria bacterium RIFCSPLOWO2_12_FULL_41_11 TaxID=1802286 RepID=A0A1G2LRH0_9BACT|nr:MAG: hypothetical protein A3D41_03830 [Candidatus Sungbacteria bacterium RIFCSPHIGHO2_02_FULL_41_12b]OHA13459.1 MAG: hypothetical protein A3G49_05910 [Candidatus Sungbacteria bacterium RIFCSPLOWO2_12_FULL_41_11]